MSKKCDEKLPLSIMRKLTEHRIEILEDEQTFMVLCQANGYSFAEYKQMIGRGVPELWAQSPNGGAVRFR